MVEIKRITDWDEVYDSALFTQRKETNGKSPTAKWKLKTCYAQHSILRDLMFTIKIYDLESFVIGHLVRHKKETVNPYVSTLREDLTGIKGCDINRLTPNNLKLTLNARAIIDISRQRICNKASLETRQIWAKVLEELKKIEPELYSVCVSQCIHSGFCTEYKTCGYDESIDFDKKRQMYVNSCVALNRK